MIDISVVIPVYGCPEALIPLHERLVKTVKELNLTYELILVNDACPKNSWVKIRELCVKDKNVKGVNLSRNFGQVHATNAGLKLSKGEYVVVMDCDLQDRPEGIKNLYEEINKGFDIVYVKRKERKDNFAAKWASKTFYKVYNYCVDGYYDGDVNNFSIARRKIVDEYNHIKDRNKSYTTTLSWMGFNAAYIEIEGDERFEGKSSYNLSKKINLAIDMITSMSNKPLKAMVELGVGIAFLSFVYIAYKVVSYFVYRNTPEGWTSTIAAVFLMGGLVLVCLGIVGIYIGNIFNQTKDVPEYLIAEILNKED